MKNRTVLLLWYQQGDNFGDVLIYQTTKAYLEEAGYYTESHEIGDSEIKIADHANQCGFVLFAGGGIIEKYVPRVIRNIRELQKLLQVPYGVIGIGIGEFDYLEYTEALRQWVDQAEFFYVRDRETRNYLNGLSENKKVQFSGDVVFVNKTIIRNIPTGFKTGLNMRDIPYTEIQGEFDWNLVNSTVDRAGCRILIPDCNMQTACLKGKFENLRDLEGYETLSRDVKAKKVVSSIQKCDVVIAMRFHVVLVAALLGVVPIPILYCPKVRYLAEQLGIIELAASLGEWEEIPGKVEIVQKRKDQYLRTLGENITAMQKKVQEMYKFVISRLGEL